MSLVVVSEDWILSRPYVREQFESSGGTESNCAARELARFFTLTRSTDRPLALINPNIDVLWHTFIEFTEDYGDFCIKNFGYFIHHRARTSTSLVPIKSIRYFYDEYLHFFGELPPIWETGAPSEITAYGRRMTNNLPDQLRWSGWPGRIDVLNSGCRH